MKTVKLMAASTLENAIAGISKYMDHHKLSAFDASLILSYIFGMDKEAILDLIIEYRTGKKPIEKEFDDFDLQGFKF